MSERILFVDDEPNVLAGLRRQLYKRFDVETAASGEEGLAAIGERGPFAVVVSDIRMPSMNGAQFLARVRERSPDSVRMVLSGHAELDSAIAAVNQGEIFRFLTKPCETEALVRGLETALDQYRLVRAERELLENTLSGAVKVLTELLGLVNPEAFSRTSRITRHVETLARELGVDGSWEFRVAAMLSQIGCLTLPAELVAQAYSEDDLSEEWAEMFRRHPETTARLLSPIPRLEEVSRIIAGQLEPGDGARLAGDPTEWDRVTLGAQILRAAVEFDRQVAHGRPRKEVLARLRKDERGLPERIVEALGRLEPDSHGTVSKQVTVEGLQPQMVLDEDVRTKAGMLLVRRGEEVTVPMLARLRNFARGVGVVEPFRVLVQR